MSDLVALLNVPRPYGVWHVLRRVWAKGTMIKFNTGQTQPVFVAVLPVPRQTAPCPAEKAKKDTTVTWERTRDCLENLCNSRILPVAFAGT